ncbi:MAG: diacylglycerol kinase [Candidatus Moranbacteria bacterium GW2011_GWE1_35_17]|nr:MAG: diacylglycerol kinase [Candidatus Moranbacteria bacterium GW2011_GWE2_35_164]KKP68495.1 MAG: diacylglycerol kinase [Candidatus Moranbacteria bacterium GW2011_GWE1_35_17]
MKGVKNNKFKASFKCATRGLQYVIRNERNFRIELVVAIFIVFLSIIFGIKIWEFIIVVFLITGVLVTELMNTVVERVVDILEPRVHPFARLIKDITAGVVLISALVSFLVGLLIFLPYIFNLLNFYF